ncbi:hypothetical protein [Mangrovibrevibacter kandeliae]|uniref:hypothetical protein n=1 Tax=Mangrovibrevibacter kandeliae TaxID=2968473 RepID=UPI002118A3C8|nr:hypothetical protein [Aurantimonas sp. CSK15Z-1]MCQ8781722.1 hypothetical protein [Aurantimonas sp. CSK15Z-1]
MNLYEQFSTDQDAESGRGISLRYGEGINITIHRAGGANRKFLRRYEAKTKPYTRQIQNGTMDEEVSRQLMAELYAETVIVGWEGVTDREGNPLQFNVENATKLLLDLPELFRDIQGAAQDRSLFLADAAEAVEGN